MQNWNRFKPIFVDYFTITNYKTNTTEISVCSDMFWTNGTNNIIFWYEPCNPLGDVGTVLKVSFSNSLYRTAAKPHHDIGFRLAPQNFTNELSLGAVRQQSNIWAGVYSYLCRHMASSGHNVNSFILSVCLHTHSSIDPFPNSINHSFNSLYHLSLCWRRPVSDLRRSFRQQWWRALIPRAWTSDTSDVHQLCPLLLVHHCNRRHGR